MDLISDTQEYIDGLPFGTKVAICIIGIIFALIVTRLVLINPWKNIVKSSSVSWDDQLLGPLAVRLNLFILAAGGQLSSALLIESDFDYNNLQPYFGASYIMIATSITSISAKYLMPVVLEELQKSDSVTVSEGNPFLVICTRAALYFVGTYFALIELDIDLFGIFASLTLIALILGIAMQQTISNIANSFLLAVDRPFEVGDRIEIGETIGTVVSIGVLSTKVLDRDERLVVIPNNTIISSDIINHAKGGGEGIASRKSLVLDIGVSYDEDIDHVKYTLLKLARESPHCLKKPEPRVLINELDEFTKNFRLFVWIENFNEEFIAKDWILRSIDENFNSEGISISFPTGIEIESEISPIDISGKAERQQIAREQMVIEEQRFHEERETARLRLNELEDEMLKAKLSGEKVYDLEFEVQELESKLNAFEREG